MKSLFKIVLIGAVACVLLPGSALAAPQSQELSLLSELSNQKSSSTAKETALRKIIQEQIDKNNAQQIVTDVTVIDFQKHRTLVGYNQDTSHFAASVNKLPIAWLTLQDLRAGKFTMDDVVTWQSSDVRGGAGKFDQPGAPMQGTVRELLFDMLNHSGNTAVRILTNYKLGLAATVNDRLAAYPEIPTTRLWELDDPTRFYLGFTTSRESLWILQQLVKQKDSYGLFVEHALATNIYLSYGVKSQLEGNDYIVLINKMGYLDDPDGYNRHDVGLIYNLKTHKSYGYAFLTTTPAAVSNTAVPQAEGSLQKMGRGFLRYAGDKPGTFHAPKAQSFDQERLIPKNKILY